MRGVRRRASCRWVLAAGASGILLHEAIGHGLEADFNRKATSIYSTMMGQRIAPELVTIVDDGTVEHARGALNTDDEGNPTERTTLVEKGILTSYLHDRISARHYGVPSTGSGRRESFRHTVMPRMRCTTMLDGPHEREEVIGAIRGTGIIAETFLNGEVQIGAGDFTFYIKNGWLVEDGKVTAPHQGHEHHRQRSRGAAQDPDGRRRLAARSGRLDLRQERPGRAGLPGTAHRARFQHGPSEVRMPEAPEAPRGLDALAPLAERAAWAVEEALRAGADDAWATARRTREVGFTVRNGELEEVSDSTSRSLGLRLFVDGRYSAHSTTDLRPASVASFLEQAVAATRALEPDEFRRMPDPARFARGEMDLDLADRTVAELDRERRLACCHAMNARVFGQPKVISVSSSMGDAASAVAAASSNGFAGAYAGTSVSLVNEVTLDEGQRRPEETSWRSARHLEMLPPAEEVADEALTLATARLGAIQDRTRRTTMVVEPRSAGRLVARLLGPSVGGLVQQERSFWRGRLGQKVVSDVLTVVDDPRRPRGLASRPFDREGFAASPLPLIESGHFANHYLDTYYGAKLGQEPTTGSPSNRVVVPGQRGLDEILSALGEGVLVTAWLGGNMDSTTGDFSIGVRGHRIEQGRRGTPVAEMNVTGNMLELFSNLVEVGDDPWAYSPILAPTLVFENVQFSGA